MRARLKFGFVRERGDGAQPYYRGDLPAQGLRALGHEAWCAMIATDGTDGRLCGADIDPRTGRPVYFEPPDVIVLRCWVGDPFEEAILEAREAGQIVLVDIDDDVWHMPAHNPASKVLKSFNHIDPDKMLGDMRVADGIVASSPTLAGVVRELVDTPVFVCRAGIDVAMFDRAVHPPHDPLRIGYLGAFAYRRFDLDLAADALREVQESGAAEVWHLGAEHGWGGSEWKRRYGWSPAGSLRWRPFSQLPDMLMSVDVVVIPQVQDSFNQCRSANTGLACLAAGLPIFASPTEAYRDLQATAYGVTLVEDDGWEKALHAWPEGPLATPRRDHFAVGWGPEACARQYLDAVAALRA